MRYLAGIVFLAALLGLAAPAGAHTIAPGWGYAEVDEQPFNEPGGGPLLPANEAYPRGRVKDLGTSDGTAVRINVTAVGANGQELYSYFVTEGNAVYTDYARRFTTPAPIAYLRYDFCKVKTGECAAPYPINRPTPPGGGGGGGTPVPAPGDRDGDGARADTDCDDTNSTVRPGAPERPGNGLDDDCVNGDQAARLYASIGIGWHLGDVNTILSRLRVDEAPLGARVLVRCLGKRCRFGRREATVNTKGSVNLLSRVRRRLRPRTTLEIAITAPNMIGKVRRYRIRRGKEPLVRRLCLPPGATKPGRC